MQNDSQIGTVQRSQEYAKIRYLNESGKRQSVETGTAQGAPYASLAPVLLTATPQHASMTTLPSSTVRPSVSQAAVSVEDPQRLDHLPKIVGHHESWQLDDLLRSDFKMLPSDKDFELSHEQLIKCVKILLFKQNLIGKKTEYERGEVASMVNERIQRVEELTASNLEEVNVFLHEVHTDLENYIKKNNKVHEHFTTEQAKAAED